MQINDLIALDRVIDREPILVSPEMPLLKVVELMSKSWANSCLLSNNTLTKKAIASIDYSCVLVAINSRIVGIFTKSDLVDLISARRNISGITIGEVMTKNVITLTWKSIHLQGKEGMKSREFRDIFTALNLLRQHQIGHIPITDKNQRLLGLVTQNSLRRILHCAELLKFRTVKDVMSRAIHASSDSSILEVARLMADYKVDCIPIVESTTSLRPIGIITEKEIVQFQLLQLNGENIPAETFMSTSLFLAKPKDSLWLVQQQMEQHSLQRLIVTDKKGELSGIVTQADLLRAIAPGELKNYLEIVQSRVCRLEKERIKVLKKDNKNLSDKKKQDSLSRKKLPKEELIAKIALQIYQSLELESILNTTVAELRQLIEVERVLIYRFEEDYSGTVTNESVSNSQLSIINGAIKDSCFEEGWLEPFRQGHFHSNPDIYQSQLSQCHIDFLEGFQVKANISIPILLKNKNSSEKKLWGLLIVHQCSAPRNWQDSEIELLQLLATQVAIAVREGELYQQAQTELARRQKAEATLQEKETQLQTVLDAAAMGTWSWQIDTNEIVLSERSKLILGFVEDDVGTLDTIIQRIHPKDRNLIDKKVSKAIEEGGLYEVETRIILPNGKHRWLAARGHVLVDAEGKPTHMIGVTADITEKKQSEEKYLHQQRLESLGSLAGGIAHDLNNILTPIMMSVQLLPLTLSQIDSRSEELIQMLENNVKRGSALVQQILSFSRGIEGERVIVQVKHLIADIKQIVKETFPKSIDISIYSSPDLWTILGDITQIHQILLNLVINARDAMPDGGKIELSAVNLLVDEKYVREHSLGKVGSYVAISVSDTGVGIPPENIDQVFEPFFTTKGNKGGTGLGLATVVSIVQSHGGFIDVVSDLDRGTQFNVLIPAIQVSATDLKEHLVIPKGKGELVLVVDDEATIREITRVSLETHNYRVIVAKNGIEAIASYVQNQAEVAVVLMNMMMPEIDGATAIRTLQKINPNIKIVVVSGNNNTQQTLNDSNLNIGSFLAKPYSTYALLETIHSVVTGL